METDEPNTQTEEMLEKALHRMLLELRQKTKLQKKRMELEEKLGELQIPKANLSDSQSGGRKKNKSCACCIVF